MTGLPSLGDHKNNNLVLGPDGKLYFVQGTATNMGIVGLDNWVLWGRYYDSPRDIPCKEITLRGVNATTADPRSLLPFQRVRPGAWYGWPDYWNGQSVTELKTAGREKAEPLLAKSPYAFEHHSAPTGFDFAPASFGFEGQFFVAEWGSGFPATTQTPGLYGYDVLRLDPRTRRAEVFARNKQAGPASLGSDGGFERPVAARFGPDGALYVPDWGHLAVTRKGPYHVPDGGVLWRIARPPVANARLTECIG